MNGYTLLEQLKIRLKKYSYDETTGVTTFDNSEDLLLQQFIDEAVSDVITYRHYPPNWEQEDIENDLKRFNHIVLKLAMFDYNKQGAEFELQNSENGDTRHFVTRQSILNDITPFVTVL